MLYNISLSLNNILLLSKYSRHLIKMAPCYFKCVSMDLFTGFQSKFIPNTLASLCKYFENIKKKNGNNEWKMVT